MTARRRPVVVGWAVAAVLGLALDITVFGPDDVANWLPDVLVGWAFLGGAVWLDLRAPDRRLSMLLGLTGVAWFLGGLGPELVFVHRGPLVHLLFAHATGRLGVVGRVVVPVAYVVAVIPGAWGSEPFTVALTLALALAVVAHRRGARGPVRRARDRAAVVAAAVLVVLAGSALARLALPSGDADGLTLVAYQVSLVAVSVAATRGVARAAWRRAPVTDLVVQLGDHRSGAVRDALARELGDPTLQVGYGSGTGFVDASGRPLDLPSPEQDRASTTVERRGEPVAVLVHDPAVLADDALLDAVAVAARLAEQNSRLQADVEGRLVDLEDSRRRLVATTDDERSRLAQRLDRGAGARLSELSDRLLLAAAAATGETRAQVVRAQSELERARRDLAALAAGLRTQLLGEQGLPAALRDLAKRSPVPVRVSTSVPEALSVETEVAAAAWFVCSEAVANAVRHADADGICVDLRVDGGWLQVSIQDDGSGGADPASGSGLRGLSDRVEALGGEVQVVSNTGVGTLVGARLPLRPVS